jgi:hypothetical protein
MMTLEDFKDILRNVPIDVRLRFAGFAEPFQNEEFSDILVYANGLGYHIAVYTTLVCFRDSDYEKIKDLPFEFFHVHDIGQEFKDYPFIDEWKKAIPNDRAGNLQKTPIKRKEVVTGCTHTIGYHLNTVLPNGDVLICCQDWSMTTIIGNLHTTNYNDLNREWNKELCRYCNYAV